MQKRTFEIGTGVFGKGAPKVCVPIVAKTAEGIWEKAEEIAGISADMAEWRADYFENVFQEEKLLAVLRGLKERLGEKALLFTFRTAGEGGVYPPVEKEDYYRLNQIAAASGCVDLIDLEAFLDEERSAEEIGRLKSLGVYVIASNHDFERTPETEDMAGRLRRMEELGADVAKLAVMPVSRADVLRLLQATLAADEALSVPLATMSMGKLGAVSRLCGSLTGSAMTFASMGESSAPGQISAEELPGILEILSGE